MNPDESSYNTRNNIRNDFLQTFSVYRHWRSFGLRARTEKQTCGTSHLYPRLSGVNRCDDDESICLPVYEHGRSGSYGCAGPFGHRLYWCWLDYENCNQVRGITTAAGLWAAACIGLAIGIGFYEVAIAGGILIFIVLSLMQNMDYFTRKHTSVIDIYVELENREYMGEFIEFMRDAGLTMSNLQMEPDYLGTNSINSVAFVVTVRSLEHRPHDSMIDTLRHIPHLKFIEEL